MDFSKGLKLAYETKWSYVNNFSVRFTFVDEISKYIGWDSSYLEENINLHIINIDTPQLTNQGVEVFVGDQWKIHNGRDELYRFSITFRDYDQMELYTKFVKAYFFQKTQYFDDCKITVELFKDSDYLSETDRRLYAFENTMIDSVSQVQFNNTTEGQIAEFSVNFKSTFPIIDSKIGTAAAINSRPDLI